MERVTPEQHQRAGRAIAAQIAAMASTPTAIARRAKVSPSTLLALIHGTRWPSDDVQERVETALGWRPGAIVVRAVRGGLDGALDAMTDVELSAELTRRLRDREVTVRGGAFRR